MMRHFIGAATISLALLNGPAQAEETGLVVLELFTSQGCSSCPPADKLLGELSGQNADILALSFHVDYWDYIGWTDTFADPSNTQRQKTYAHHFKERMVYTPQLVVQGQAAVVGHRETKVAGLLRAARNAPSRAKLDLEREGGMLRIALQSTGAPVGETELHLVRFTPEATVQIGRGENSGRRLTYTNVVMSWHVAGVWNGTTPTEVTIPLSGDMPTAVLLHQRGQGDVLAAAALR